MSALALPARSRAIAALGAACLFAAAVSGCTNKDSDSESAEGTPAIVPVKIATNLPGRTDVPVNLQLAVTATDGALQRVTVESDEPGEVTGALSADKSRWVAAERLEPGTAYVVTSVARDSAGGTKRSVTHFSTMDLTLDQQTWADVAPLDGETVGVGMPVIVTFDVPVTDKASMERHMTVTSEPAQRGSWYWLSDNEAHWRPASYWEAGSDVTVDLDINSVDAGGGIYGQESRHVEFHIGDAHVYKVNAQTHKMQVFSNGRLLRTIPITTGKEGFTTRSGVKVIIEKFREKRMNSETVGIDRDDPEYYDIDDVAFAMRLTYSGEFIHAAPWSVASQGFANVSHGCTGMSDENAHWLYDMTIRGDVAEYVGTDRPMEFTNGWGDWNLSFADYRDGSALA